MSSAKKMKLRLVPETSPVLANVAKLAPEKRVQLIKLRAAMYYEAKKKKAEAARGLA